MRIVPPLILCIAAILRSCSARSKFLRRFAAAAALFTGGRAVARDSVGPAATRCSRVKGAATVGITGAKAALPTAPSALLAGLADWGLAGLTGIPRVGVTVG